MNKKFRILIPIDHKWRDLASYVYLGELLEKQNLEVRYCRNTLEHFFVDYWRPDAIILNQVLSQRSELFAKSLKGRGVGVYILPTEGIPTLAGTYKYAVGGFSDLSGIRRVYCWNEVAKRALLENSTISEPQLITVGVPRFDFYAPKFRHLLLSRDAFNTKYRLPTSRKNILIATNFTQASFHFKNQEFMKNDAKVLRYDGVMKDVAGDVEDLAKMDYESQSILIDAVRRLASSDVGANIILKLHPAEDRDFYERALADLSARVIIISQEIIWDALANCDVEVNRSCTTAFESWIIGKPTIEFRLNPNEWYKSDVHSCGSYIATSYADFEEAIRTALHSSESFIAPFISARQKVLSEYCGIFDGKRTKALALDLADDVKRNPKAIWKSRSLKNSLIGLLLKAGDWLLDDLRVYGPKNFLLRVKVDRLGRVDKHVHDADISFWQKKLSAELS